MQYGRTFDEKRDFIRMKVDCDASVAQVGASGWSSARCVDLSAGGVLVETHEAFPVGARIMIQVEPKLRISTGLFAELEVVRQNYDVVSRKYQIGAKITEIHQ